MARFELALLLADRRRLLELGELLEAGVHPRVALARVHFSLEMPELDRWGIGMHDDLELDDPDLPI